MIEIATPHGPAHVDLVDPAGAAALFVITHGAGGGTGTPDVEAVCAALHDARIATATVLQPYRVAGRRTPPKPGPQDEAWLAISAALGDSRPLILAGRSNGARVACRTAAAAGATGVVALAFPLHPPGKPEKSRLDELDASAVPTLVVQGTRDPFGMPPPGPRRIVHRVEGADHSLRRDVAQTAAVVTEWITALLAGA